MLLGKLARRPVAEDVREVAPAHRHVAEDALHALARPSGARPCSAEELSLHGVPGERPGLARDDVETQVVLPGEGHTLLDAAPADLHVLLDALDHRRLGGRDAPHRQTEPALVVGVEVARDDRRTLRLAGP